MFTECRDGYAAIVTWGNIMNRDNIREMLADIEGAVTEDIASLPQYRNDNEGDATVNTDLENLKAQVLRVAAASTEEIDRVILELQGVRDTLRSEGERLNRELDRFTTITYAAKTATKSIGDHLKQSGAVKRR